jgi:hypothetical protein
MFGCSYLVLAPRCALVDLGRAGAAVVIIFPFAIALVEHMPLVAAAAQPLSFFPIWSARDLSPLSPISGAALSPSASHGADGRMPNRPKL